ncbi:MAG TPA: AsmA-like C-terminal domain-containing protein [Candidatus Binatia bacterium]|nr:AsmA-like C-terminal domain-containing protein [Candidatus Binatia bacterium]
MKRRYIFNWIVGIGGFLILAFITMLLVLPRLIDSQAVKEEIRTFLSQKTGGSVAMETIDLHWIPRAQVVIRNGSISVADRAEGRFETLRVYPSILDLLTGRLIVQGATLEKPALTIKLPERSEEPLELDELETNLRAWLAALTSKVPAMVFSLEQGSAEISIGNRPPVLVKDFDARFTGPPDHFTASLTGSSNLCSRFRIEAKIAAFDLTSAAEVKFERLRLRETFDSFLPRGSEYIEDGEISMDLELSSLGLRRINAEFDGSLPALTIVREGERALIKIKRFNAVLALDEGTGRVAVKHLDLTSPRLTASGEFMIDRASSLALVRLSAQDLDLKAIRDDALRTAGDIRIVQQIFNHVRGGTIPKLTFESKGKSLPDLAKAQNVVVTGELRGGRVFIPAADLHLEDVDGSVAIAGGVLEGQSVSLRAGGTRGWDGKLRLGLVGKSPPFHLDMMIEGNAAELQSMSLRFVKNASFRSEVARIGNVKGELFGRVVLGERLDAISPVVSIFKMDVTATYEPIPFPIAIKGGRFVYKQNTIRFENVQGTVGRSGGAALSGTLNNDASRHVKIDSGRMTLDLEQIQILLQGFKELPSQLVNLQSARGQIELDNLTLTGAYDNPVGWRFATTGRFERVEITHADFPDRITLSRGKVAANRGRITFSDAAAVLSDASVITSGTFEYEKGGPLQFETSGSGTVGTQMTEWLSRHIKLPEEFRLRPPLKIAAGLLAWRAGGDISFRGQVTVANGPQLSIDAVKGPQGLTVKNLTIDDDDRRARMTFRLAKDNLDLSFVGELTQQTIEKVFTSFPMKDSSLAGDMQVSASLADPIRVSARGQLNGSHVWVPLGTEKALFEKFSVEGSGESMLVRSADILWGKSRFNVSGKVASAKEIVRVDFDVTGDQLDWEDLRLVFGAEGEKGRQKKAEAMSMPDVVGTIRLKTERFTFERFSFTPLETTASISPSGIRADIDRGIACGITVRGRLDVVAKEIGLDLQLSASEAQLELATACLTNRQNNVKGVYSLSGRLAGRGNRDRLLRSLKGNFEFSARNGEFIRAPGIDATFDYLNGTGDFKVLFPDLDRETFPYRFVGVNGRIEGEMLMADEVNIDSSRLNLTGQGKIDLVRKQIDGKGLIAVLRPADEVISRIPVVGPMLGGSLVGIPVRITGSLERPDIAYLSPADVGAELLNVPLRILKIPVGAMRLFTPSGDRQDKTITK